MEYKIESDIWGNIWVEPEAIIKSKEFQEAMDKVELIERMETQKTSYNGE